MVRLDDSLWTCIRSTMSFIAENWGFKLKVCIHASAYFQEFNAPSFGKKPNQTKQSLPASSGRKMNQDNRKQNFRQKKLKRLRESAKQIRNAALFNSILKIKDWMGVYYRYTSHIWLVLSIISSEKKISFNYRISSTQISSWTQATRIYV